jgi:hypothetical protein
MEPENPLTYFWPAQNPLANYYFKLSLYPVSHSPNLSVYEIIRQRSALVDQLTLLTEYGLVSGKIMIRLPYEHVGNKQTSTSIVLMCNPTTRMYKPRDDRIWGTYRGHKRGSRFPFQQEGLRSFYIRSMSSQPEIIERGGVVLKTQLFFLNWYVDEFMLCQIKYHQIDFPRQYRRTWHKQYEQLTHQPPKPCFCGSIL